MGGKDMYFHVFFLVSVLCVFKYLASIYLSILFYSYLITLWYFTNSLFINVFCTYLFNLTFIYSDFSYWHQHILLYLLIDILQLFFLVPCIYLLNFNSDWLDTVPWHSWEKSLGPRPVRHGFVDGINVDLFMYLACGKTWKCGKSGV